MSAEPTAVLDPADPCQATRRVLRAWLAFHAVFVWYPCEARALIDRIPDPDEALRASRRAPPPHFDPGAALTALRRARAVAVPISSPAYPARLARLGDAPPVLFVRGSPAALASDAVALVGARAASAHGLAAARELARALVRAGLVVVSGLARGVDAASHQGALEAGGRTVAVQACGPDLVYPSRHRPLASRIAGSGAVVTELAPGTPPLPRHFPFRNRIISALARAVVVVEARERSGSLITARHALDQGAEVLAVPGPISVASCRGSNRLLRDGAAPVLDASDVLAALGLPPPAASTTGEGRAKEDAPRHRSILLAIEREPASRDELARRLRLSPAECARVLVELELD
ncbi:MAG: DNA-processing protein DprA, partial [Deltaproteobacteria bacterium]